MAGSEFNLLKCAVLATGASFAVFLYLVFFSRDSHPGENRRHSQKLDFICEDCGKTTQLSPREFHQKHDFAELDRMNIGGNNMRTHCTHCKAEWKALLHVPGPDEVAAPSSDDEQTLKAIVEQSRTATGKRSPKSGPRTGGRELNFHCRECAAHFTLNPAEVRNTLAARSQEDALSEAEASRVPCPNCGSAYGGGLSGGPAGSGPARPHVRDN